jgi:hypothetical protein
MRHVALHLQQFHESQPTVQALKVFFIVMALFVIFSVPICNKSLFAKLAPIWLFSSVYSHMMDKACPVLENFQAFRHWALVVQQLVLGASSVRTLKKILGLDQYLGFLLFLMQSM